MEDGGGIFLHIFDSFDFFSFTRFFYSFDKFPHYRLVFCIISLHMRTCIILTVGPCCLFMLFAVGIALGLWLDIICCVRLTKMGHLVLRE